MRKLRKGFAPKQGRLRTQEGTVVDSQERAKTLAEYYSSVQWAVRPITPTLYNDSIGPMLAVDDGQICEDEVVRAARKLR